MVSDKTFKALRARIPTPSSHSFHSKILFLVRLDVLTDVVKGIPKIMAKTRTIKTEVVSSKDDEIIFKLQQEYTPKPMPIAKKVNSLVTLTLDKEGKVRYHKDMWNEKDYSHEGLGKVLKTLNGDHLTKITQPPDSL